MANCPNCDSEIPLSAASCPKCEADFTADQGWRPIATREERAAGLNYCSRCRLAIPLPASSCPRCGEEISAEEGRSNGQEGTARAHFGLILLFDAVIVLGAYSIALQSPAPFFALLRLPRLLLVAPLYVLLYGALTLILLSVVVGVVYIVFETYMDGCARHERRPQPLELLAFAPVMAIPMGFLPFYPLGTLRFNFLLEDFASSYLFCATVLCVMSLIQWILTPRSRNVAGKRPAYWGARLALPCALLTLPLAVYGVAQTSRLHDAVRTGDLEKVQSTLKPWKSLNAKNKRDETPLKLAIERKNLEMVSLLLDRGAHVQLKGGSGNGIDHLLLAVQSRDFAIVNRVLREPANAGDELYFHAALQTAAENGEVAMVQALLDAGASANASSSSGVPVLFYSVTATSTDPSLRARKLEVTRLLIERGAKVTANSKEGRSILHGPLYGGARGPDVEMLRFLLDQGFPMSYRSPQGRSMLYYASRAKYVDAVRLFLDYGADPDDRDPACNAASCPRKSTALHQAADLTNYPEGYLLKSLDTVSLLLTRGANPNVEDDSGLTPLAWAASTGNTMVVELLLKSGADPNLGVVGRRPLDMAKQQVPGVVELLLKSGACKSLDCVGK